MNAAIKFLAVSLCSIPAIYAQTATPAATPIKLPPPKAAVAKPVATKPTSAKPASSKASATTAAPTATPLPLNRGIVFVDAAHGGVDTGAHITDTILEKDVTLSMAFKLRSLLTARGFTVIMTRDTDPTADASAPAAPVPPAAPLSLDDRAGLANHSHPLACLLLHATASGTGVHLYSSELDPLPNQPIANPWLTAQAAWVTQSELLQKNIGQAITRSGTALVMSRASVRPMDSMTCPALIVEIAPSDTDPSTVNDAAYQQRIASAIAGAMLAWKTQAQPPTAAPVVPTFALPSAGATP